MSPAQHAMQRVADTAADHGLALTAAGAGSAAVLWGLHISDIAVIVSALAAVAGVVLQFYIAMRRIHIIESEMRLNKRNMAGQDMVIAAGAKAQRAAAVKSADNSDRISQVEQKLE